MSTFNSGVLIACIQLLMVSASTFCMGGWLKKSKSTSSHYGTTLPPIKHELASATPRTVFGYTRPPALTSLGGAGSSKSKGGRAAKVAQRLKAVFNKKTPSVHPVNFHNQPPLIESDTIKIVAPLALCVVRGSNVSSKKAPPRLEFPPFTSASSSPRSPEFLSTSIPSTSSSDTSLSASSASLSPLISPLSPLSPESPASDSVLLHEALALADIVNGRMFDASPEIMPAVAPVLHSPEALSLPAPVLSPNIAGLSRSGDFSPVKQGSVLGVSDAVGIPQADAMSPEVLPAPHSDPTQKECKKTLYIL